MGITTTADTIRELTREVLEEQNGLLFGQCITAVGWIQNTVPPVLDRLVELPMNDVSGPGIALGSCLEGTPTLLVERFQSFLWYASPVLCNYASRSKELWNQPCPLLVRAIAGDNLGPVHSNFYHSLLLQVPGITLMCPMLPEEVRECFSRWNTHRREGKGPIVMSEHRSGYKLTDDSLPVITSSKPDVVFFVIGAARVHMTEVTKRLKTLRGINSSVVPLVDLSACVDLKLVPDSARLCIVIDSTYPHCSVAQHFAYEIMLGTGIKTVTITLHNRLSPISGENGTPSAQRITDTVGELYVSIQPH